MATKKNQSAEPSGYAEAMREVESIITWCNERISSAQMTVDALVADLASQTSFTDDDFDEDDDEFDDDDDDDDFDDDDE